MELKDIVEVILDHATEGIVFLLLLAIFWGLFFGGGMSELVKLLGCSLFGP